MSLVLKNVEIVCSASKFNGKKKDILIEKDAIKTIGTSLSGKKEIDCIGLKVSAGWFDLRTQAFDPGYENRETLNSLQQSALNGGVTGVGLLPNSSPSVDTKDVLEYIQSKSSSSVVDVFPYGSVTKSNNGDELVEMLDLHYAGAIGFTEGEKTIWHTGILLKALQYLQKIDGLLLGKVYDKYIVSDGQVNEGVNSTLNGIKGIPSFSETLAIQKVLEVLKYSGGKFHFSCISTSESVELIKEAKKKGLKVTCDIASHQLAFDDSVIGEFNTNYKVIPPFRTKKDIKALEKGLKEGVIDCCVSDHTPHDVEAKQLEFDLAEFGIIGVQTLFPVLNSNTSLELSLLIDKITTAPRSILGLDKVVIEEGGIANLTLFDSNKEWVLQNKMVASKSKNSPFLGKKLKGKAVAVYNKGKFVTLD